MKTPSDDSRPPVHIYFLLDRSGSMESIRTDVIGGFNRFLAEQRQSEGECVMTLVQFDSQDPFEVLADAVPLAEVVELTEGTFVPRGSTPLYDAMGQAIATATIRAENREREGLPAEDILFITFTDGLENQSREYDRAKIFDLVKRREEASWTFAYLGANQDAYAEGGKIGYSAGSSQAWAADSRGTAVAFASLSASTSGYRAKSKAARQADREDFYAGNKRAEDDLKRRSTGS